MKLTVSTNPKAVKADGYYVTVYFSHGDADQSNRGTYHFPSTEDGEKSLMNYLEAIDKIPREPHDGVPLICIAFCTGEEWYVEECIDEEGEEYDEMYNIAWSALQEEYGERASKEDFESEIACGIYDLCVEKYNPARVFTSWEDDCIHTEEFAEHSIESIVKVVNGLEYEVSVEK